MVREPLVVVRERIEALASDGTADGHGTAGYSIAADETRVVDPHTDRTRERGRTHVVRRD